VAAQPVFYYDLGDPVCYLVAERIMSVLPIVPEWEPVDGSQFKAADVDRESIERLAADREMQPLRWPQQWPPDTGTAMLAATYAKHVGRAVAFSLAAFRQAFAAGRDLGDTDTVLIAAAACEMHPTALLKGITLRSVGAGLQRATDRALVAGVRALPAIEVNGEVFEGDRGVERGAEALEVSA
jgi:2-hydroxychromene-2-carboxylate isomerase